jgi:aryl-alcohol dehydrogenase-like predicted oxidoreductase
MQAWLWRSHRWEMRSEAVDIANPYAARLVTLAAEGRPGPVALQLFYSLVSRDIEAEHAPLAMDAGLGLMPWSPLAYGLLSGKYDRAAVEGGPARAGGLPDEAASGQDAYSARLDGANPFGDSLFTDRNWTIVEAVKQVAGAIGVPPARVALAWVLGHRAVHTTLVGVSRVSQVEDNIAAIDLRLGPDHLAALDAASRPELPMPYSLFGDDMRRQVVFGGASVLAR